MCAECCSQVEDWRFEVGGWHGDNGLEELGTVLRGRVNPGMHWSQAGWMKVGKFELPSLRRKRQGGFVYHEVLKVPLRIQVAYQPIDFHEQGDGRWG